MSYLDMDVSQDIVFDPKPVVKIRSFIKKSNVSGRLNYMVKIDVKC